MALHLYTLKHFMLPCRHLFRSGMPDNSFVAMPAFERLNISLIEVANRGTVEFRISGYLIGNAEDMLNFNGATQNHAVGIMLQ